MSFRRKTHEQKISKQIDKQLLEDFKIKSERQSILLLGAGESGKTTILKQMRLIHINEYTIDERRKHAVEIRNNIHEAIFNIVVNINKLKPALVVKNEETREVAEYIRSLKGAPLNEYSQEYYDKVAFLWQDGDIQEAVKRSNEYQFPDSAEIFMNRLKEIRQPNYVPTTQDILHCRVRTTSINEIEFTVDVKKKYGGGTSTFVMYDVGGQRGERKKWISVFEGIKTVLFVISMSEFDQTLREDSSMNRLEEALTLFSNMFHSRYLQTNNAIVFLNKEDVLEKKIKNGASVGKHIARYKKFKRNPDEFLNVKLFIREEVDNVIKSGNPQRSTYVHYTTATNTENIKFIFNSVHKMLIDNALKDIVPF